MSSESRSIPVSVLVLTYNEEKKIASCLAALCWADEIVVVDAKSTDQTRAICLAPNQPWSQKLKFLERPWNGFREQRNYSLEQASHDWVLVVDADEICTPELAQRIQTLLSRPNGPELKAYKVHRQEFFQGKRIFYGMWNPSYQDRFFNKVGVQYINDVHEYPAFKAPPGRIHESLIHQSYLTVERYIEKLNHYTTIEAQDRYNQGQRTTVFRLIGAFPAHSLKSYFYYKAYKDGVHGVIISLLEGVSRVVRQIKIWQIMVQKGSGLQALPVRKDQDVSRSRDQF